MLAFLLVSCGNSSLRTQSDDPTHAHQDCDDHVHQDGSAHLHQDGSTHVHQDCDDHGHVHHTKPPGQESFVLTEDESITPGESTGEHDH